MAAEATEKAVHDRFRALAKEIMEEHGIMVISVKLEWATWQLMDSARSRGMITQSDVETRQAG